MKHLVQKILARLNMVERPPQPKGMHYPDGHFYSPIPSLDEVRRRSDRIFDTSRTELPGIQLNETAQWELVETLKDFYPDIPFPRTRQPGARYYFENSFYCQSDAIFLYAMLRRFRPRRVIEIGSGFSSAAMLDTADRFLEGGTSFTFVEPYPQRLNALLTEPDRAGGRVQVIEACVQDVDPAIFEALSANDILFIDSSHVAKTGSDVPYLMFEILPRLKPGVLVHVHDIFHPFEYPREWIMNGCAWNEDYFLRAFLSYNSRFEIVLFNTFLEFTNPDWFHRNMPLCMENTGGSIWLRAH